MVERLKRLFQFVLSVAVQPASRFAVVVRFLAVRTCPAGESSVIVNPGAVCFVGVFVTTTVLDHLFLFFPRSFVVPVLLTESHVRLP